MSDVETAERSGVQVVHRTAAILRALRDEPNGLTLSQIAERVGLARSTVYRLVAALEQERFVVAASSSRGFRLGPGLAGLMMPGTRDLTSFIHPYLVDLSAELNETVDLAVREQDHVLIIDRVVAASRTLLVQSNVGALLPCHSTAPGKVLLAALSNDEVVQLLPARLERLTPQTIASRAKLLDELERVRSSGVAYANGEHTAGIDAVAVAVGAPEQPVGAISVPLPAQRFKPSERAIVAALRRTQAAVNALFGDE
jgi:DNA-binding IclR family transcriptional regulator